VRLINGDERGVVGRELSEFPKESGDIVEDSWFGVNGKE
jgi:hypothetical protein